ncbi:MAG: hypothetical protein HOY79_45885 [Streptomyces sp.]|nr:hypothetical protein [Streptomyces sp.]
MTVDHLPEATRSGDPPADVRVAELLDSGQISHVNDPFRGRPQGGAVLLAPPQHRFDGAGPGRRLPQPSLLFMDRGNKDALADGTLTATAGLRSEQEDADGFLCAWHPVLHPHLVPPSTRPLGRPRT